MNPGGDTPEAALARRLTAAGRSFEALEPLGGASLRLRFLGTFEGRETAWDARFVTLEQAWRERREAGLPVAETDLPASEAGLRQFIEVGEPGPAGRALTVGLPVPALDGPTLEKAIRMVRQYRLLRRGRHEWGAEPWRPAG